MSFIQPAYNIFMPSDMARFMRNIVCDMPEILRKGRSEVTTSKQYFCMHLYFEDHYCKATTIIQFYKYNMN